MLELKNIHFSYLEKEVLKGINLSIREGQTVVLTGPSGCGKTSILRLINGVIPHYYKGKLTGDLTWKGTSMIHDDITQRAFLVGSVFQNPKNQFFCVDTTGEVAFALENYNMPREEMKARIQMHSEMLHTGQLLDRNIFHLSGGEKQMVAVTAVSAMEQEVLVLDEPSSSLDQEAMLSLANAIREWKKLGKTIIIAEHRLFYLQGLIDRMIVMEKGEIMATYDKEEITSEVVRKHRLRTLHSPTLEELKRKKTYMEKQLMDDSSLPDCSEKISFENYRYHYRYGPMIFNMNLAIKRQGISFIIGGNGVGKTTFLRCLCGLNKRFKGMTKADDFTFTKKGYRHCFLVMQDVNHQLFTESVLDEVLLSMPKQNNEDALEFLELMNLKEKAELHPMSLSGGEKQRLAVACALASEKEIIIFDEPTSGLDYYHMQRIIQALRLLVSYGRKPIVVTHDYEFIDLCEGELIGLKKDKINKEEIDNFNSEQNDFQPAMGENDWFLNHQ